MSAWPLKSPDDNFRLPASRKVADVPLAKDLRECIAMSVLSHGIDMVELAEFKRLLDEPTADLARRCFTERELDYAGEDYRRTERLAARFAAKEAVLKALGTGWVTGISWKDIEVSNAPNGAPSVSVFGQVKQIAMSKGVSTFLVSLSHSSTHAIASVIAVGLDDSTSLA
jgi:holo-[acyl-carrier protein] synthase